MKSEQIDAQPTQQKNTLENQLQNHEQTPSNFLSATNTTLINSTEQTLTK